MFYGLNHKNRKIDEKKNRNSCYNPVRKEGAAMPGNIKNVTAAIDYIESHLHEKLELDTIAEALHYSKYQSIICTGCLQARWD